MRKIKLIISSIFFCVILLGIGKFLRYILIDDTSSYTRVAFHEMYEQDNIDVLFVGSSHCYRSFIPEIFDQQLGLNTFNAGTSAQHLDGSYMIIKEAARYNELKHIYLEVYYNISRDDPYKSRTNLTQTYIISDYLRPSLDKIQYMLNASAKNHYSNTFILARRNWPKFLDADYVKDLMIKKRTDVYKNYEYAYISSDSEWYDGKGYVANNGVIKDWNYFSDYGWDIEHLDQVSEDWLRSLENIIAFCQKENIPLTLISVPVPDYRLLSAGNYDEYVNFVQNIIDGTNINYYDFNLCKEDFFPNTSSLFMDDHHLNCYGAEAFSKLFADFINGKISEKELFYHSYEEKVKNLDPTVFGVSYKDHENENGEPVRDCKIISTEKSNLEYEISYSDSEKKPYKIQNYSDNRFFTITPAEHGSITITYRLSDSPDDVKTCNISY